MADYTQYAFNRLVQGGLTPTGAMGLLGNWQAESGPGLNPLAKNPNSPAIGIAQWNDRAPALMSFAKDSGKDWRSLDTQIDFALHELHGSEGASLTALNNASNVRDAVLAGAGYERPEGYSAKNPMGTNDIQRRLSYGNQLQGLLGDGSSGSGYAASSSAHMPAPAPEAPPTTPGPMTPNSAGTGTTPDQTLLGLLSAGGAQPNVQSPQDSGLSMIKSALSPATSDIASAAPPAVDPGAQRLMQQRQMAQQLAMKYLAPPAGLTGLLG